MPHYVLSLNQMRDLGEYLRAYVAYVSANLGWGKALRFVLVWLGNVCPAGCEDFGAVARMGGDDLDDWLGASWLYLRTLRNVETPPCAECELNSAKPKTAAVEGRADIPCLSHDGLSVTANTSTVRRRPFSTV